MRPGAVRAIEYEIQHRSKAPNIGLEHTILVDELRAFTELGSSDASTTLAGRRPSWEPATMSDGLWRAVRPANPRVSTSRMNHFSSW